MDNNALLKVEHITKRFGGLVAVNDISFELKEGSITGLIGPNGAGKTTLFNCIAGVFPPTEGKVFFDGKDITGFRPDQICHSGIGRTFQIPHIFGAMSAVENVMTGAFVHGRAGDLAAEKYSRMGMIAGDIIEMLPNVWMELGF